MIVGYRRNKRRTILGEAHIDKPEIHNGLCVRFLKVKTRYPNIRLPLRILIGNTGAKKNFRKK